MSASPNPASEPILPDLSDEPQPASSAQPIDSPTFENVPVKISAVLGKTKIDVAQLRQLEDGAVIELNRKVGEPIDLYVNDRLIARGELVMVDGSLGVTMTEIVKDRRKFRPKERENSLMRLFIIVGSYSGRTFRRRKNCDGSRRKSCVFAPYDRKRPLPHLRKGQGADLLMVGCPPGYQSAVD